MSIGYDRDRAKRARDSRPFPARFPGRCNACEERIHENDSVRYVDDALVHAECPDVPDDAPTTETCGKCFLTIAINGKCGCDT